jgi:hypothetical protein
MDGRPGARWAARAAGCLVLVGAGALAGFAAGESALPEAARKTVERFGNGGTIEKVAKENEDGLAIYSVLLNNGGKKMEVQTTLAGDLNSTEEPMAPKDLPAQVSRTARGLFPQGVVSAERAVVVIYEVEGKDASGATREARITLPGVALFEHAATTPVEGKDGNAGKK